MKACRHRLTPEKEGFCLLYTNRWEGGPLPVFRDRTGSPVKCTSPLARVCPFREESADRTRRAEPCPCCRGRHYPNSNSQLLCRAWYSVKDELKRLRAERPEGERFYPEGTTSLPYPETTPDLVRRLVWSKLKPAVLRRDRYRCQDCGTDFGARRRKVFDPKLRKGRGGFRWESLEVHHIVPRAKGGSDHPGNLKTLCPACHRDYTDEQSSARAAERREQAMLIQALRHEGYEDEVVEDPRD